MTTTAAQPTDRRGATNAPVELGRYTIPDGERVIYGQRVLGIVRLVDSPGTGRGRRYIIERDLTVMAEVDAIVEDYLDQAARWQLIPAAGSCALAESAEELLTRPFILHPSHLDVPPGPILGAASVHGILAGWRKTLQGGPTTAVPAQAEPTPATRVAEQPVAHSE